MFRLAISNCLAGRSWLRLVRRSSSSYGSSNLMTLGVETKMAVPPVPKDELEVLSGISGVPGQLYEERVARIFVPARNAMQSGTHGTHQWRVMFNTLERWENPLMGWCSNADAHSNLCLEFDTKEQAMAYCQRQGWAFEVDEKHVPCRRPKSYAENFHYSRRTRVGSK